MIDRQEKIDELNGFQNTSNEELSLVGVGLNEIGDRLEMVGNEDERK